MDYLKYFTNSSVKKARCSTCRLHKAKFSVCDNDSSPKDTLWGQLGRWTTEWKNRRFGRSLCQHHSSSYIKVWSFFLPAQCTWRYFIIRKKTQKLILIIKQTEFAQTELTLKWHEKRFLAGHMLCCFPEIEQTHHQVVAASAGRVNVNTSVPCFIGQFSATCCMLPACTRITCQRKNCIVAP